MASVALFRNIISGRIKWWHFEASEKKKGLNITILGHLAKAEDDHDDDDDDGGDDGRAFDGKLGKSLSAFVGVPLPTRRNT